MPPFLCCPNLDLLFPASCLVLACRPVRPFNPRKGALSSQEKPCPAPKPMARLVNALQAVRRGASFQRIPKRRGARQLRRQLASPQAGRSQREVGVHGACTQAATPGFPVPEHGLSASADRETAAGRLTVSPPAAEGQPWSPTAIGTHRGRRPPQPASSRSGLRLCEESPPDTGTEATLAARDSAGWQEEVLGLKVLASEDFRSTATQLFQESCPRPPTEPSFLGANLAGLWRP